jgi:hypothetical protein
MQIKDHRFGWDPVPKKDVARVFEQRSREMAARDELSAADSEHVMDLKFHCSQVDRRKERLKVRVTTRRETLLWKIYAELARQSGEFNQYKFFIINKLTRWERGIRIDT